ncbi:MULTISPECIES: mannitol-1-phosphate 5-dehydrogenase [Anoxybacillus]|uniref:Mannitol-1-phosphate 5-dehydrogenase n=1 Tax=Anoxybacillus ayderensis TaxID=265546 RepID=A0A0D0HYA3_9BACL|nr:MULTISPECIES: mannitol-1-phosphate 5-dehydrogenase [Anoxybacillus]EPZ38592.1 mannitol-1-phosphate 5-dehydrogenase [Anoxybacillus ayderensis]KIP22703.1 Mannitol-1-phosphate 5-dehydrogenase [Anoxybacillus ayderensis]NNU96751.1 mannitol-1-phosphate 5-dehydrogenase [Anoxybacillus sp. EFIL]
MLAVHFGAGNIGRGFIGSLLSQSGYDVVFVDVNDKVVQALQQRGQYEVIIAGETTEAQVVRNVSALHSQHQRHEIIDQIARADLVTTAVGPNVLSLISQTIAEGLQKRITVCSQPIHVIACENMIGGSEHLKKYVWEHLSEQEQTSLKDKCAFLNCAVDRIVPNQSHDDPLTVVVEPFFEWVIETKEVIGDIPHIIGAHFVDDLQPYIERKLFTVNTGHAIVAYLGYRKKYETIHQAMADGDILSNVTNALRESGRVLVHQYGWDEAEHQAYIEKIVQRFVNPSMTDEVTRVARSPIRKLGPNDRLIRPAMKYYECFGEVPTSLAKGIAALLLFDYEGDAEAVQLQKTIKESGVEGALETYAKLPSDHPLAGEIKKQMLYM